MFARWCRPRVIIQLVSTQHLLIDLSPKYSFCHRFSNFIRCKGRYKIPITKGKRINNAEILKAFLAEIAEILKDMHLIYAKSLSAY